MSYDFMGKPKAAAATKNTLSVDGILYERLLAKLDEHSSKGKPSAKRVFRRLGYAHPKLSIHIESEGHNSRELVVASRNLSQGGVSVLHSNFMYTGTQLTIDLYNNRGNVVPRHGTITRCEHRGGRVHEIGIKFDDEINLRKYLHPNPEELLHSRERINPEDINIKVLIYSKDTEFSSLMRQHLLTTSLCYKFAKTNEEVLELFEEQDMLIFEVDTESMETPELVRSIRDQGFKNPIILAGRPKTPIDMHVLSACGADMVLPWPCDEQTMLCSIGEYIVNEWTADSLENIRSCVSPETRQVLTMEIAKIGVTLDQQIRTNNQPEVHKSCLRIKMMAPLLGLGSMKNAIDNLTLRVANKEPIEELAPELSEICMICKGLNNIAA